MGIQHKKIYKTDRVQKIKSITGCDDTNQSHVTPDWVYTEVTLFRWGCRQKSATQQSGQLAFMTLLNILSQYKQSSITPSPSVFPPFLYLTSGLQQTVRTSVSLTENVDSPTGANIRCLCAHMGTITISASHTDTGGARIKQ